MKNINSVSYIREIELTYKVLDTPVIHMSSPATVCSELLNRFAFSPVERFFTLLVNNKNKIVGIRTVSIGTVSEALVHPREVFCDAVRQEASGIIVAHNHPSGNASPSSQDIETTKRLKEAGKIIGIPLLDHIIFTDTTEYYSMKENGYI